MLSNRSPLNSEPSQPSFDSNVLSWLCFVQPKRTNKPPPPRYNSEPYQQVTINYDVPFMSVEHQWLFADEVRGGAAE